MENSTQKRFAVPKSDGDDDDEEDDEEDDGDGDDDDVLSVFRLESLDFLPPLFELRLFC